MSLYRELKQRNVFRVAIAYLALAWLLTEVAGVLFPAFGIPDWAFRLVVILFVLGLVPTLVFSWAYEITPEGLKREKDVVREESITGLTAKRLDGITIVLLVLALAFVLADRIWFPDWPGQRIVDSAETMSKQAQEAISQPHSSPKSIAVLPFVNMSDDPGNEFFSDGISEELLNLLAKIPDLRVIARTSSFAYKGKDATIPDIARELNVAHVLEGSVRKAGDKVRITAQLIRADDSSHEWSETYDRTLDDIFAIQDDIAASVVDQLKVKLLGGNIRSTVIDPDSYGQFLQARHYIDQGTAESFGFAISLLEGLLAVHPDYAAAWSELGRAWSNQLNFRQVDREEALQNSLLAMSRALELDPDNALILSRWGYRKLTVDGDLEESARYYQRALEAEPGNAKVLTNTATLLNALGRLDQAIRLANMVLDRDPLNPVAAWNLVGIYVENRQYEEAEAMCHKVLLISPEYLAAYGTLARIRALRGDMEGAAHYLEKERVRVVQLVGQVYLAQASGNPEAISTTVQALTEPKNHVPESLIALAYARLGNGEQTIAHMKKSLEESGPRQLLMNRFDPEFDFLKEDPRWQELLFTVGLSEQQLKKIQFELPRFD